MKIKSLTLKNFRNYGELSLFPSEGINLFLGQNAQGKTNILEAIYYSALGRSHRTNVDSELINLSSNESLIGIDFFRGGVENRLDFKFRKGMKREIIYNGLSIPTKNLIGSINVVLFSPEDLHIVKGSPASRRKFLDMEISQADKGYFHDLMVYTHIITQRNSLLKKMRDKETSDEDIEMIRLWDEPLAAASESVARKRIKALKKLDEISNNLQKNIAGSLENLKISYEMNKSKSRGESEDMKSWYLDMLRESTGKDIMRGYTSVGPHRDDIKIEVNGIDLRVYGSQGQQRTGALSMKLAELDFFKEETGEYPVLLLDDVFSELDRSRRESLISFIEGEGIQTFITATDREYFDADSRNMNCSIYNVVKGKVFGA